MEELEELEAIPINQKRSKRSRRKKYKNLPDGVTAVEEDDPSGACFHFTHDELGRMGKIVLTPLKGVTVPKKENCTFGHILDTVKLTSCTLRTLSLRKRLEDT
ncbi:hypothetical protein J2Z48_000596 [Croceifilum oryzae]|uniref:Uncharacterized protein n=1 Tax=Croceifilum oryzae TaxID=1553429 RepID=A0AAJ1TH39_9BACL|nr:hypothetical protein [Croceifilum oryzae]MDQ0416432.1 hypothetical protein [Croceifilum oryzae]